MRRHVRPAVGERPLLVLAGAKTAAAVVAFSTGATMPHAKFPIAVFVLIAAAFGSAGGFLRVTGRGDRRASALGGFFVLLASMFAQRPAAALAATLPEPVSAAVGFALGLPFEALLPAFLWGFVADFPRTHAFGSPAAIPRLLSRVSAVTGLALLAAGGVRGIRALEPVAVALAPDGGVYWPVLLLLIVPAIPFAAWKSRMARADERRRTVLFVGALGLGIAPIMCLYLSALVIPPFRAAFDDPTGRVIIAVLAYLPLLSLPFTTAWAVLVHRVLDVDLVLRKAAQYALARYTVVTLTALPFVALVGTVWRHRESTIAELATGSAAPVLAAATLASLGVLRIRARVLAWIDRRFFREQYDSREILTQLVERSRSAADPRELAELLTAEIERALHLEAVAVLVLDPATATLAAPDGRARPLAGASTLARLVGGAAEPLEVDMEDARSPLARLPEDERQWVADGGYRLLIPLVASDGSLAGMLALGDKRSEMPFTPEDTDLLAAIASSGSLVLENRLIRSSPLLVSSGAGSGILAAAGDVAAAECVLCGTLDPPGRDACRTCGGATREAAVPAVLPGRYRFERRVGHGGMGIVYRAIDLALGRAVAVKTLPRVAPEHAMRLRREARAMAALSHPNLALIFGAESWKGMPMLVFEFLGGGTLADRLEVGPLDPAEAISLGATIADVLDGTHRAGILHRDIKPSNNGYTTEGTPKLMDFGLSRILDDSRLRDAMSRSAGGSEDPSDSSAGLLGTLTVTDHVVGTPLYLAPEALLGEPPGPSLDLWALALVLYEAVAGANPMAADTLAETFERIRRARLPDPRETRPSIPSGLAALLREALAREPRHRPATARELRDRLRRLADRPP